VADDKLVELADVELTETPGVAGGVGSIVATTGFLWRETGLRRGGKALLARRNTGEGWRDPNTLS